MSASTRYGFQWGPVTVERVAHIEGRGYCVSVKGSGGQEVQVLVSEKGRRVTAYPINGAHVNGVPAVAAGRETSG